MLELIQNAFIFKQPNLAKYAVIPTQVVKPALTANYQLPARSKSKKECVIYLMLCR